MRSLFVRLIIYLQPFVVRAQEIPYYQVFFDNSLMSKDHYYSEISYSSPSWIFNSNKKLPVEEHLFFTPGNSLELKYISAPGGNWTAKLLYHPIRGIDFLYPAKDLVFRLYVNSNTSVSELPEIAIGNKKSNKKSPPLKLQDFIEGFKTKSWIKVSVPLTSFKGVEFKDPKDVDMIVFSQQSDDQKEHQMFIDQVELVPLLNSVKISSSPKLLKARGYEKHVDIEWEKVNDPSVRYIKIYRSPDNKKFRPVAIERSLFSRFSDYVGTTGEAFFYKISFLDANYNESPLSEMVKGTTLPMTDEALLTMVQEANFRYYWEGAEPSSGLALENIPGRRTMIAAGASGFGMMALLVGIERKFITREEGVNRFIKIVNYLEKSDKFHGAFAHFMNGETGKVVPFFGPVDNGGDLVETAFLVQGILAARAYFSGTSSQEKLLREQITRLWDGIEWDWYRKTPDSKYLFWHWSPDQEWKINHKLIGWNETMIVYLLGMSSAKHPIPASMYYTGWASQDKEAQDYRKNWGQTEHGSMYANGNTYYGLPLKVGVSNGGPLFFIHYSFLGANPKEIKDKYTDYFSNNRNIALINYRYCVENPERHQGYGEGSWGLTASDGPWGYSASEPVPRMDDGKMTPTGALASFPYTPEQSMEALKNYYHNYGKFLWGAYGFRDAFNLNENWCSPLYMGLNQAPVVVMIENYRTGLLWKLFMSDPDIKKGLKKLVLLN